MAVNPMQRKSRNSFLLGVIVTLLFAGVAIVLLFLQLKKVRDEQAAEAALKVNVYTLKQDVKSGQVLTQDMFRLQTVNRTTIPNNATSVMDVIDSWYLQTKDGEAVCRDKEGLYLNTVDSIIEVYSEEGKYYRLVNGEKESITIRNEPNSDEDGMFVVDTNEIDVTTRVYQESTGNFYIYKVSEGNKKREKQYLEMDNVPVIAKVDMSANTVITQELVVQSDEKITNDVRKQEYNIIILPTELMTDDYIDIRLMLPNGQDFIVVSKKQVTIPTNSDGSYISDTVIVNLREEEILSLSSAIVEAFGIQGSKLYATRYVEPGMQDASVATYVPNGAVTAQLGPVVEEDGRLKRFSNQNLVEEAIAGLKKRYENAALRNQYIQAEINKQEGYDTNIRTEMDESITNTEDTRKKYLESLGN